MPVRFDITVDTKAWAKELDTVQKKQLPFATATALNRTANDVQAAVRAALPASFTLRRRQFVERTVKIENKDRATKTRPAVRVGIDPTRDVLAKFEEDRQKTPREGHFLAVPVDVRANKSDVVPKAWRPGNLKLHRPTKGKRKGQLVGKAGVFVADGMILQRVKPDAKRPRRQRSSFQPTRERHGSPGSIRVLYLLRRQVKIRPTLKFAATARATVERTWQRNMSEALAKALATAKG